MTDTTLWIETDSHGTIQGIAPDTARLLGLSQRGAHARDVRLFFPTVYRPLSALLREAEEQVGRGSYPLYPRDRRPIQVHVRISPSPGDDRKPVVALDAERANESSI